MPKTTLLRLLLAVVGTGTASAQPPPNTTVTTTILNLHFSVVPKASVVAAAPSPGATTYLIGCPASLCGFWPPRGITLTEGPSTYAFSYSVSVASRSSSSSADSVRVTCAIEGGTTAFCTMLNVTPGLAAAAASTSSSIVTVSFTGSKVLSSLHGHIVVTAGAEKLLAAATAASASATTTAGETAVASESSASTTVSASSSAEASAGGVAWFEISLVGVVAGVFAGMLML